jgi:hypothetical protein
VKDEIDGKKGTQTNDVNEPERVEVNEANTDLPPPHELVIQLIFSFGSLIALRLVKPLATFAITQNPYRSPPRLNKVICIMNQNYKHNSM